MITVLTVALVILAIALIGLVLMQRSEGGALGIGGGGGMSGFMTGRSAGSLLTKMTAVLGALFMIVSLALAFLSKRDTDIPGSVVDQPATEQGAPVSPDAPRAPTPGAPALPEPGAPLGTGAPSTTPVTPGGPTTSGPSETESGTSGGTQPAGPPTGN